MAGATHNEITSDLDVEQSIFRDCQSTLEDLAAAFGRAAKRPGGLSAGELAQLRGLSNRAFILLASVAFPVPGSVEDRHGR